MVHFHEVEPEESVFDRWNTYDPAEWHGARNADHIAGMLHALYGRRIEVGLVTPMTAAEIQRDAALLWSWLESARIAREG